MPTYVYTCPRGHDFEQYARLAVIEAAPQLLKRAACPEHGEASPRNFAGERVAIGSIDGESPVALDLKADAERTRDGSVVVKNRRHFRDLLKRHNEKTGETLVDVG